MSAFFITHAYFNRLPLSFSPSTLRRERGDVAFFLLEIGQGQSWSSTTTAWVDGHQYDYECVRLCDILMLVQLKESVKHDVLVRLQDYAWSRTRESGGGNKEDLGAGSAASGGSTCRRTRAMKKG